MRNTDARIKHISVGEKVKYVRLMLTSCVDIFSDKAVSFTNWADGQPGMISGAEDCCLMEFTDTGYWHDYPCDGFLFFSENHGWICEYG